MKRLRTATEKLFVAQRMNPGVAGGRTPMVAPTPGVGVPLDTHTEITSEYVNLKVNNFTVPARVGAVVGNSVVDLLFVSGVTADGDAMAGLPNWIEGVGDVVFNLAAGIYIITATGYCDIAATAAPAGTGLAVEHAAGAGGAYSGDTLTVPSGGYGVWPCSSTIEFHVPPGVAAADAAWPYSVYAKNTHTSALDIDVEVSIERITL